MANSILAARAGAVQIDGCTRRFGAGADNTPVEDQLIEIAAGLAAGR